jgi:ParB/RepB/Spo0J family partition protein
MERVSVASIDYSDRTFCVTYPILDDRLTASIKQFGILSPPIVLGPAPYRVVTGFRRLEAARYLGISEVPCFVETMDQRTALLLAINDNILRPLNVVEKAFSVAKITNAGLENDQFEAIMKSIGVPSNEKMIRLFSALAQSDEALKAFAAKHNLGTHEVAMLLALPSEERSQLLATLAGIHLTSSLVREIVELARLLFIKEGGIPFEDLEGLTNGDELKAAFKRKAYPLLTQMEKRLKAIKDEMRLPPRIGIAADPYFEKSNIDIRITARNEGEVQESIKRLQLVTDDGQIRSIFDLISGKPPSN